MPSQCPTFLLGGWANKLAFSPSESNRKVAFHNTKAQQIKCQLWGQAGAVQHRVLLRTQKAFSVSHSLPQPPVTSPALRVSVLKNNFHTHAQQMLVKLATRAIQKKGDSNTDKRESKKLGKRKWKKGKKIGYKRC